MTLLNVLFTILSIGGVLGIIGSRTDVEQRTLAAFTFGCLVLLVITKVIGG